MDYWRKRYKEMTNKYWSDDKYKYLLWLERNLYRVKMLVEDKRYPEGALKAIRIVLIKEV